MSGKNNGPVLIELSGDVSSPEVAPVVPDIPGGEPQGKSMQVLTTLATKPASRVWRMFWGALVSLLLFGLSLSLWDFVFSMLARNVWLGRTALVLTGVLVAAALALAGREWLAFVRLRRIDGMRAQVEAARVSEALQDARKVTDRMIGFFAGRADLRWALGRFADQRSDLLDGDGLLDLAEMTLVAPLDSAATREIEAAARQVATMTAIVPLALVDVVTALAANLRMVRRIAEIYGGRAGIFGSWRLLRTVLLHLVATGAVSIGDDLIGSLAGGGLVSKLSRRFGEGVVNGALTARVGVAAMEVCRPMPFHALKRPGVTGLVKRALSGVFGKARQT